MNAVVSRNNRNRCRIKEQVNKYCKSNLVIRESRNSIGSFADVCTKKKRAITTRYIICVSNKGQQDKSSLGRERER